MPASAPAAAAGADVDIQQPFFEWLTGGPTLDAPLRPAEQRLLARMDTVLASDTSRSELLPRAPAVIPQLLSCLRDDFRSSRELSSHVAKDPLLVAEVLRMANGAHARALAPVTDLGDAIGRLGTEGLRRAISRVVLKPIFDAAGGALSARAAPKLWLHSEVKAGECMRLAKLAGLEPFEGYLAGLMHNIGWTASLRAIDRGEGGAPAQFSRAFVHAYEPKRDLFFAMLVMPWQLTDSLTALAVELLDAGLSGAGSTLGRALAAADRHACLAQLGAQAAPATDFPSTAAAPRAEPAAAPARATAQNALLNV